VAVGIAAARAAGGRTSRARAAWRAALIAAAILATLTLLALLLPDVRQRAAELFRIEERTDIWSRAWRLICVAPLAGIGIGEYTHFNRQFFPDDRFALEWITAHNQYLHLWAERGLFGLALYLTLVGAVGGGLWRAVRDASTSRIPTPNMKLETWNLKPATLEQVVRLALLGGLVNFAVEGLGQYNFYVRAIETTFWLFVGWSTWLAPARVEAPVKMRRWPRGAIPLAILVMAAAMIGENWERLQPLRIARPEGTYNLGGGVVYLPIPPGAHRLEVTLGSFDPALTLQPEPIPLVYTVSLGDAVLSSCTLRKVDAQRLTFDLPTRRAIGSHLTISVSRTWSPWGYGMHSGMPIMELGVMWTDPLVVE